MHQAASEGRIQVVQKLICEITSQYPEIGSHLSHLAAQFQLKSIVTLTEARMNESR